ncbi:NAD(P)H-dependent FMN reductase [Mucilaginibacter mallensis]|uniref:NAD(P)H-dependent FMN reductase n=1 Tax=Mucilaginibacter mallensis TaxID=652787 RepID=A0A1H1Z8W8_MUCMA|nr:NADPH-dependent FMN reductase [Mucilaginibacter mallensis]SDT30138.1 NAD(P)H-dependent FMN reductase [Mucilaginibacter mallensis]
MNKNIFAISGSLRSGSSNHNILKFIGTMAPAHAAYNIYNNLAQIPPFDPGLDNETPPNAVTELRNLINHADAVIICTPEYAFGVPGQLKNTLDWLVSSSTLVDKPVSLITASSVGNNAHTALLLTLGALSANVIEEATLLIPFIRAKMDDEGNITDKQTREGLENAFSKLLALL